MYIVTILFLPIERYFSAILLKMATNFQQPIKKLMYAYGDVKNPHPESVEIVEVFTRQQTQQLVKAAAGVASMRDDRVIYAEDVMFVLRKDTAQLRRLIQFMGKKIVTERFKKRGNDDVYFDDPDDKDTDPEDFIKRLKLSLDFLTPRQIRELRLDEPDPLTIQRLERQDEITDNMSFKEYKNYIEQRSTSLVSNLGSFKEWIGVEELTNLRLKPDVFDVIGHLAHETVKKLVELSVKVKADMSSHRPKQLRAIHSLVGAVPSVSDPPFPDNEDTQTAGSGSFVHGSPPLSSPANTLTSPGVDQVSITTGSLRRSSREARKRQRGTQVTPAAVEPQPLSEEQPPVAPALQAVGKRSVKALQPVHIKEALRRLTQSQSSVAPLWAHSSTKPKSWCL